MKLKVKIKHSPEVAPVVHGHFIHDGPRFTGGVDWWHCSNCGKLASGVEIFFDYCPYCGTKMDETERIDKKQIINNQTHFNYDKEHDLLYVNLKNCPNHYVEQLEDSYFDLWRDSKTDEIVGAHIWNASEWFRMILKTAEEHSTIKKAVAK